MLDLKKKSEADQMGRPVRCCGKKLPDGYGPLSVCRSKRTDQKQVRLDRHVGVALICVGYSRRIHLLAEAHATHGGTETEALVSLRDSEHVDRRDSGLGPSPPTQESKE